MPEYYMILVYGIIFGLLCIALFLVLLKTLKNIAKAAFGVFATLVITTFLITTYIFYDLNQLNNALEEDAAFAVMVNGEIVATAILPTEENLEDPVQTLVIEDIDFEAPEQDRLIFAFDIDYFSENDTLSLSEYGIEVTDLEGLFTAQSFDGLGEIIAADSEEYDAGLISQSLEQDSELESIKGAMLLQVLLANQGEAGIMLDIVEGLREDTVKVNENYLTLGLLMSVPEEFISEVLEQSLN